MNLGPDRRVAVERAQTVANRTGKDLWMWEFNGNYHMRTDEPADMPVLDGMTFEKVVPSAAAEKPPKNIADFTDPEIQYYMQRMGHAVSGFLPGGLAHDGRAFFTLIVFDTPGLAHYVTNAARKGVIKSLRTLANRLENEEGLTAEDLFGLDGG